MTGILSIPDEILDKILSYITFDEVSHLRLVCKTFDAASQRVLNQGFYKVEKYHSQCLRKVKEQLPRRESERRKHPLAVHCDILTAIETRLSLLGMTFMKYVELKYCCFIPGKVLDEIYKILRFVSSATSVPRAHDILQELRDISSMAMEHFDEKIAPGFRGRNSSGPKLSVTSFGSLTATQRAYPTPSALRIHSNTELIRIHLTMRQSQHRFMELRKENTDIKRKLLDYRRKLNEHDRRLLEQNNIIVQQSAHIAEQGRKLNELTKKFNEFERTITDVGNIDLQLKDEPCSSLSDPKLSPSPKIVELPLVKILESKHVKGISTMSRVCIPKKRRLIPLADKRKRQKR